MANTSISNLTPSAADLAATDVLPVVQTTGVGPVKMTGTQIKTGIIGAGSVSIASTKTLTANNTLTLAGTDSTTMTFPATSATIARTDAGQTFTGDQTFNGGAINFTSSAAFSPLLTVWNQTNSSNSAYAIVQKSRGASGAGAAVQVNDILGTFLFKGADTAGNMRNSSYLEAVVTAVGASSVDSAFRFNTSGSTSYANFLVNGAERIRFDGNGNVIVNTAAIATNATNGFLYVPTCAGTPTGTPTTYTGRAPIVVDTTNNKLYFYSSGVWRDAGP